MYSTSLELGYYDKSRLKQFFVGKTTLVALGSNNVECCLKCHLAKKCRLKCRLAKKWCLKCRLTVSNVVSNVVSL